MCRVKKNIESCGHTATILTTLDNKLLDHVDGSHDDGGRYSPALEGSGSYSYNPTTGRGGVAVSSRGATNNTSRAARRGAPPTSPARSHLEECTEPVPISLPTVPDLVGATVHHNLRIAAFHSLLAQLARTALSGAWSPPLALPVKFFKYEESSSSIDRGEEVSRNPNFRTGLGERSPGSDRSEEDSDRSPAASSHTGVSGGARGGSSSSLGGSSLGGRTTSALLGATSSTPVGRLPPQHQLAAPQQPPNKGGAAFADQLVLLPSLTTRHTPDTFYQTILLPLERFVAEVLSRASNTFRKSGKHRNKFFQRFFASSGACRPVLEPDGAPAGPGQWFTCLNQASSYSDDQLLSITVFSSLYSYLYFVYFVGVARTVRYRYMSAAELQRNKQFQQLLQSQGTAVGTAVVETAVPTAQGLFPQTTVAGGGGQQFPTAGAGGRDSGAGGREGPADRLHSRSAGPPYHPPGGAAPPAPPPPGAAAEQLGQQQQLGQYLLLCADVNAADGPTTKFRMVAQFRETVIAYCHRLLSQGEPASGNLVDITGNGTRLGGGSAGKKGLRLDLAWQLEFSESAALEAVRILDLLCLLDNSLVSSIFPAIKRVYERRTLCASLFCQVLQFLLNHGHHVIFDVEPVLAHFFLNIAHFIWPGGERNSAGESGATNTDEHSGSTIASAGRFAKTLSGRSGGGRSYGPRGRGRVVDVCPNASEWRCGRGGGTRGERMHTFREGGGAVSVNKCRRAMSMRCGGPTSWEWVSTS